MPPPPPKRLDGPFLNEDPGRTGGTVRPPIKYFRKSFQKKSKPATKIEMKPTKTPTISLITTKNNFKKEPVKEDVSHYYNQ